MTEHNFKRAINKIGIVMILFFAFINIFVFVQSKISILLERYLPYDIAYIISKLLYGIAYFSSFVLPGIILYLIIERSQNNESLLSPTLPSPIKTAAYIFASMALILTAAVINANLVSVFNYSDYSAKYLWNNEPLQAYQVILSFITSALIPAFAEEFLFRGAILSALKPYGKAPAIIISAVLFGLMHQNVEQLLYATVAGLILAFIVYETGSVWCSVLVHFFTNFSDILKSELIERYPTHISYPLYYLIEGSIFILGLISAVYLIVSHSRNSVKASFCEVKEDTVSSKAIAKHFFSSPTIILFVVLSFITMAIHIFLSILNSVLR